MQSARPPRQSSANEQDKRDDAFGSVHGGIEWGDRPDALMYSLMNLKVHDKLAEGYIMAVRDLVKQSYQKRKYFGTVSVVEFLTAALKYGPPGVAKASAQVLKILSFCQPNHGYEPIVQPRCQC
jgi:hypothetical protein